MRTGGQIPDLSNQTLSRHVFKYLVESTPIYHIWHGVGRVGALTPLASCEPVSMHEVTDDDDDTTEQLLFLASFLGFLHWASMGKTSKQAQGLGNKNNAG